jgi:hypothetical protein
LKSGYLRMPFTAIGTRLVTVKLYLFDYLHAITVALSFAKLFRFDKLFES